MPDPPLLDLPGQLVLHRRDVRDRGRATDWAGGDLLQGDHLEVNIVNVDLVHGDHLDQAAVEDGGTVWNAGMVKHAGQQVEADAKGFLGNPEE